MSKHLDYFTKFGDEAADWVIDLARKAAKKQSDDKSSSASDLLRKGIAHPVANFMVGAMVLVGLL
jgi:acetylxylan esterase